MSSERLEEVTLVNDSSYLHLRENDQGFMYALFDKESKGKMCDGQIDWTELEDSPIGNPLTAARNYAFSDIGIDAETVTRVSMDILESFMDEQMAWKVGRDNYLILQTCDDGWDYTLYDKDFKEVDGGQLDMPELSMQEARSEILQDFELDKKDLVVVDYDEVAERAEMMEAQQHKETYAEREANLLAEDLDEFSYSFDPYEYFDSVEDRMEAVQSLKNHILSSDLKNIKDLLQTAIDEESEYADVAKELIHRLDEYFMKCQSKEKKPSILDKLQEHKIECSENGRKKPTESREEIR